jgi:hypothetical protein
MTAPDMMDLLAPEFDGNFGSNVTMSDQGNHCITT